MWLIIFTSILIKFYAKDEKFNLLELIKNCFQFYIQTQYRKFKHNTEHSKTIQKEIKSKLEDSKDNIFSYLF